ncbi:CreA family protein [Roseomonas marmotae]|uniref:CreA family protein n=1 Tax=Roseomonas marmotae TaxID=2768161 RepID=A0ABS3KBV6_9PROT|nr:CreA family protein [Roseomonas marmotae]MBO1074929.1 CreA family protein [Roseomonas marmotae]QTI80025.1 CreA family protein [Roseomonas marmotae]
MRILPGLLMAALLLPLGGAGAQTRVGEVSTTFRIVGPNDKVVVERYDDPRVPNVSCYVSRADTGGLSGWVGLAEDPSRFSLACRATGPVTMPEGIPKNESVFRQSASALFKALTVTRIIDEEKRVLVYLITSTKIIDGSPYNSVTAVPIDAPPR